MTDPYPCSGPLRCECVLGVGAALVLLTHLPGRAHLDGQGKVWSRDLEADLTALRAWGADAVVCLVETHELAAMGVPGYFDALHRHGLSVLHLPIIDMSTPGPAFQQASAQQRGELTALLSHPSRVVVHCAAGLGRTGLFCASLLVQQGWPPQKAIAQVRAIRPGAIETAAQEDYIARFDPSNGFGTSCL